jgi:hypothetical protein
VCAHSARAFLDGLASRIRAESMRSSALLHQDEPAPEISSAAITTTHRAEKQQRQEILSPKVRGRGTCPPMLPQFRHLNNLTSIAAPVGSATSSSDGCGVETAGNHGGAAARLVRPFHTALQAGTEICSFEKARTLYAIGKAIRTMCTSRPLIKSARSIGARAWMADRGTTTRFITRYKAIP